MSKPRDPKHAEQLSEALRIKEAAKTVPKPSEHERKAQAQATALGHNLTGFYPIAENTVRARCHRCNEHVVIKRKPRFGEEPIAGLPYWLACKPEGSVFGASGI